LRNAVTKDLLREVLRGVRADATRQEGRDGVKVPVHHSVKALRRTRETGFATFFSRSRNTLWTKGETSGNRLKVTDMLVDCDDDTVLLKVTRLGDGNVCHTGERTCFFRKAD